MYLMRSLAAAAEHLASHKTSTPEAAAAAAAAAAPAAAQAAASEGEGLVYVPRFMDARRSVVGAAVIRVSRQEALARAT
jgi:hypothetical protein